MPNTPQTSLARPLADDPSAGCSPTIQQVLREPAPSLLLGAALLAGQPYLLHSAQLILDDQQLEPGSSCWTLMVQILEEIAHDKEEQGYTALFHLLVEPFALVNQSVTREKRKENAL